MSKQYIFLTEAFEIIRLLINEIYKVMRSKIHEKQAI